MKAQQLYVLIRQVMTRLNYRVYMLR